jgi:hypothetical protein
MPVSKFFSTHLIINKVMSQKSKWECLNAWLEQTKKNNKYGKPKKRILIEDEVEFNYKPKKKY